MDKPVTPQTSYLSMLAKGLPAFLFMLLAGAQPAAAALVFCNRLQQPIEAALGYRGQTGESPDGQRVEDWISEGWWRIEPGQCARVYNESLGARFYFYYARALAPPQHSKQPRVWSGKYMFCTAPKAFRIEGDNECESRGYETRGFHPVDLGAHMRDYTLDFRDSG
jgi:uncharacterized membrane protein